MVAKSRRLLRTRLTFDSLLYRAGLHEEDFPDVAIEILEAMRIHEAMILRLVVSTATGPNCLANHLINLLPVIAGQSHQHFRTLGSIANGLRRKALELCLGKQHGKYIFADHHAGGGLIGKLL